MAADPQPIERLAPGGAAAGDPLRAGGLRVLVEGMRPRHGLKNLLVLVGPAAAGSLFDGGVLREVATAFLAFWLAASGMYLLNDVRDAPADRRHARKAARPVASGRLAAGTAVRAGVLLVASGLAVAAVLGPAFLGVVAGYVAVVTAYVLWARDVPVLDLAAVASGFYLRAAGGAVAIGVPVSRWFAIVAFFGSLLLVAGKRQAERLQAGDAPCASRPALARYSVHYLRQVVMVAAAVALGAYCLWAFERADAARVDVLFELSIVPFVVFVLRYVQLIEDGRAEEPESLILRDRGLLAAAAVWCAAFGTAVTLG